MGFNVFCTSRLSLTTLMDYWEFLKPYVSTTSGPIFTVSFIHSWLPLDSSQNVNFQKKKKFILSYTKTVVDTFVKNCWGKISPYAKLFSILYLWPCISSLFFICYNPWPCAKTEQKIWVGTCSLQLFAFWLALLRSVCTSVPLLIFHFNLQYD